MSEPTTKSENYYLRRAGCAPLVAFTFVEVGELLLQRWGHHWPDHPALAFGVFGICIAAGIPYLLKTGGPLRSRIALVVAFVPAMAFILGLYGFCLFLCIFW